VRAEAGWRDLGSAGAGCGVDGLKAVFKEGSDVAVEVSVVEMQVRIAIVKTSPEIG